MLSIREKFSKVFSNRKFILIFPIGLFAISCLLITGYFYWRESQILVHDLEVTNVTNGTATVTWQSSIPNKGVVFYSESDVFSPVLPFLFKNVEYDDRDIEVNSDGSEVIKERGLRGRYTHHITIEGLKAETTYYFRVGNGFFKGNDRAINELRNISFTTGPVLNSLVPPNPVYGQVVDSKGDPIMDGVVKLNLIRADGTLSSTVSAAVNGNGGFSLDVANSRYLFDDVFTGDADDELFEQEFILEEGLYVAYGPPFKSKYFSIDTKKDQPTVDLVIDDK